LRSDRRRLEDILEAIDRIDRYAVRGRETLERDELIQNWVVRHLEIIGEACRGLSSNFRQSHPSEMWSQAIGLRNILVHQYFEIAADPVWDVIENDLPKLRRLVLDILDTMP
jgi:uncharacterized protein with HEPN domain